MGQFEWLSDEAEALIEAWRRHYNAIRQRRV